ncbi:2,3-butanediol dehydrogenase [Bacillus sp. B15-48]|uniref:2,3-butanediol dehydrogenase n=1 Tax=Bacillus sp. B15-48 TaxID=1548601 RepID=UPI00193FF5C5|nr:2,3-butanediol dehydrogenase [Bacillus sp. B15-48]MBM4763369.1 alcohol dehydrogenase catalytic domain-containing protein [Bacillus sp. B15-48]
MKAMQYYGARNVKVEEVAEPFVQQGTVKIKVKYAGICGTDLHEYHAQRIVPTVPMIMSHEFTGEIVEIGDGVTKFEVGDRVVVSPIISCMECPSCRDGIFNTCDNLKAYGIHYNGGFAEYAVIPEANVIPIPDSLSYELAAIVEPASVAMQAVHTSTLKIGDKVAVFGAGPIGLLITQCAKAAGASQIFVVEIEEARQKLAFEMGADIVINPLEEDAAQKILELTDGGVNIAYEAAGVEATFNAALDSIRHNGEVMIVSVFTKPVTYNPVIQEKGQKKIHTSRGYFKIFPRVIALLQKGSLQVEPIITSKIALDDIVELGFEKLDARKDECKILVSPEV